MSGVRPLLSALLALLAAVLLSACERAPQPASPPLPAPGTAERAALVERGAYLAVLGNCAGCHTAPGGAAYAGGRALFTPFGRVQAGNLTPAAEGLGGWSADDFWQALHHGRGRDGRRLLPVFPYTAYTQVTRADSDALFVYLQSLPAVAQVNKPHGLRFPYNTGLAMAVWQGLYFRPAEAAPQALPRGAYLVQGLGHCAACHAPRNRMGASSESMSGGWVGEERWWAPSLHPPAAGEPRPSAAQRVALMRDGVAEHGSASGPMAAVVAGSLQHWRADDLQAAADYLLSLAPQPPRPASQVAVPLAQQQLGRQLYQQHCADCHGERGQGARLADGRPAYPPLAGNPTVLQPEIHTLVRVLQHGSFAPQTRGNPRPFSMPPQVLDDDSLAAVLTHIRTQWGNAAAPVLAVDVLKAR